MYISREEAEIALAKIKNDPKSAYNDEKAPWLDHNNAVTTVNMLLSVIVGAQQVSWIDISNACEDQYAKNMAGAYGVHENDIRGESRSSSFGERKDDNDGLPDLMRDKFEREGRELRGEDEAARRERERAGGYRDRLASGWKGSGGGGESDPAAGTEEE